MLSHGAGTRLMYHIARSERPGGIFWVGGLAECAAGSEATEVE